MNASDSRFKNESRINFNHIDRGFKEFNEIQKPENKEISYEKNKLKLTYNIIKDAYTNNNLTDNQREQIFKDSKLKLSHQGFLFQFDQYNDEERKYFLDEILRKYDFSQRQEFVNNTIESPTYSALLLNLSDEDEKKTMKQANPHQFGVLSLINWLNTANLSNFFSPTQKNSLSNKSFCIDFDTFDQYSLWIEPYGFYTSFNQDPRSLNFNLYTLGVSGGGECTFFERLVLDLGLVYSYSKVDWDTIAMSATVNSFYFGPSLSYLFLEGYVSCMVLGILDLYQVQRATRLFPNSTALINSKKAIEEHQSWDLMCRLDGQLSYDLGHDFHFYPNLTLDYLHVFQQEAVERLEKETEMTIDGLSNAFFRPKAGMKLTWELFKDGWGFLIPSFSLGWIGFIPLSTNPYSYQIIDTNQKEHAGQCRLPISPWNEIYGRFDFELIYKRGFLLYSGYQLAVGTHSTTHSANIRLALSW